MLYYTNELPSLPGTIDVPEPEVLTATSRFFIWEVEGEIKAIGGEMLPEALGNRVYVWLILSSEKLSRKLILAGMKIVKAYLASLPWEPYAECALAADRNEKFLLSCGFAQIMQFDDRSLFRWSSK